MPSGVNMYSFLGLLFRQGLTGSTLCEGGIREVVNVLSSIDILEFEDSSLTGQLISSSGAGDSLL